MRFKLGERIQNGLSSLNILKNGNNPEMINALNEAIKGYNLYSPNKPIKLVKNVNEWVVVAK